MIRWRSSTTNADLRGVDGLRVVDASIMPNIPRANINLTAIMIGERVAEWMRGEGQTR
jgi:choline dehydrogenase